MPRLYQSFYLTLLGCNLLFVFSAIVIRHSVNGLPLELWSVIFVAMSLLLSLASYPLVRRLTRRLERLQAMVESLGKGDLSARVPVEGRDEVARLARHINATASQIEALVSAQKSLLSHTSHELRTPLTRIRLTVALMKENADPRRKAELEQDIAELDALLEEILLASRLGAPVEQGALEEVDLLALVAEECARYEDVDLHGTPVLLQGQPRLLRRLARNLLENAQRYGQPPIEVSVVQQGAGAVLTVRDQGPGIAATQLEQVFEPFFRCQPDTSSTGTGLGLALVRQIARLHGGDARCEPAADGRSHFVVTLGV